MDPKIGTFGHIDTRDLAILGVKKIVFWTFSKFLKSCFSSVWVLILTIKDLLFPVFWAPMDDKWPRKLRFSVKILLILADLTGHFWPFLWVKKKSFSGLFKIELFRKCLGFGFGLKRQTCRCFLALSYTLCYPKLLLFFGIPASPKKRRRGIPRATSLNFVKFQKIFKLSKKLYFF